MNNYSLHAVSGGLVLKVIRDLDVGESPDGEDLAAHIMTFYSFTLALNVISTCASPYHFCPHTHLPLPFTSRRL